jgi:hypothetical protein
MTTDVGVHRSRIGIARASRLSAAARIAGLEWSAPAWGAIAVTSLFLAITCWWLTQDRSIPIFDAGLHLSLAIAVHNALASGRLLKALTLAIPYPPFAYLVGSLGILVGGVGIAPLVLAENFVFVSLLALGCYNAARLAFGPLAGLLAVVFALGSPLITAQFHVFMTDAPETAMVAVSVWLVIATEGFSRLGICALAGLAAGLGMLTKEPFAIFLIGVVGVTALRGGRGSWRGLALFAAVALVIALPWYVYELKQIRGFGAEATASSSTFSEYDISGVAPPRLSPANLEWYLWSILNSQLYLPLFMFAAVGWLWALVRQVRRRPVSPYALELLVGAFLAWAILTETFVHDTRYGMPLLVYLAVFGAGWIVQLQRRWRIGAALALALVALANTLGTSFGAGAPVTISLPGISETGIQQPGLITIYQDKGFLVGAPRRDGDFLAMLQGLKRQGIRKITWSPSQALEADFSGAGVEALRQIAGLGLVPAGIPLVRLTDREVVLAHEKIGPGEPPPCVTLEDHTGVWVRIGDPGAPEARDYCPLPRPHFYG